MSDGPMVAMGVVAYLTIRGAQKAIDFYTTVFGATVDMQMPSEDGRILHASLSINGGHLMLSDDIMVSDGGAQSPQALGGTSVTLHLNLNNGQETWDKAIAEGADVVMPLEKQFWGEVYGQIKDPFGHIWSITDLGGTD